MQCHRTTLLDIPIDVWATIAFFLHPSDISSVRLVGMRLVSNRLRAFHLVRYLPLRNVATTADTHTLTVWTDPSTRLEMRHVRHMGRVLQRDLPLVVRINAILGLTVQSHGPLNHFLRIIGHSCLGLQCLRLVLDGVTPACDLNGMQHMPNLHHLSVVVLTGNLDQHLIKYPNADFGDIGIVNLTKGLSALRTLRYVDLQLDANEMSDAGALVLGSAMRHMECLRTMHISVAFNPITRVGLRAICEGGQING